MRIALSLLIGFGWVSIGLAEPAVKITRGDSKIDFHAGEELVASYHIGSSVAKPYFWPLNAPGAVTVTRGWPMVKGLPKETTDHVHQKSAWFCHGDIIPEGLTLKTKSLDKHVKGIDFWSETPGHGKIRFNKADESAGNRIVTYNVWQSADGDPVLDEIRGISLQVTDKGRLLTVDIILTASYYPITFGDTKEGSFGVRVSDEIKVDKGNGTIWNAAGKKNGKEVWGQPSDWNDYSGKVGDKTAGIAIFDDRENPKRALWHTRDYGLMAANPFGRNASGFPAAKGATELVKLPKDGTLKLRYAIYLHSGDTKTGDVAGAYELFLKSR